MEHSHPQFCPFSGGIHSIPIPPPLSTREFPKFTLLPLEIRQNIYAIASEDFVHRRVGVLNRGFGVIPEFELPSGLIPFLATITYASRETYQEAVLITLQNVLFSIPSSNSLRAFYHMLSRVPRGFAHVRKLHFEYVNQFSFDPDGSMNTNKGPTNLSCGCEEPPRPDVVHTLDRFTIGAYPGDLLTLLPRLEYLAIDITCNHLTVYAPLRSRECQHNDKLLLSADKYIARTRIDKAFDITTLKFLEFTLVSTNRCKLCSFSNVDDWLKTKGKEINSDCVLNMQRQDFNFQELYKYRIPGNRYCRPLRRENFEPCIDLISQEAEWPMIL